VGLLFATASTTKRKGGDRWGSLKRLGSGREDRRACWAQVDFKGVGLDYPRLDIIRSVVRCFAGGAEDTSEVGSAEARGEVEEDSKTGTEGVDGVKEIRTRL